MTEGYDPGRAAEEQRDRNAIMQFAVTMEAIRRGDFELLGRIEDMNAAQVYEGESLGLDEFLGLIGVEPGPDGQTPVDPFINACIKIDAIPAVQALPTPDRVRALATAMRALDHAFAPRTPSAPTTGE